MGRLKKNWNYVSTISNLILKKFQQNIVALFNVLAPSSEFFENV